MKKDFETYEEKKAALWKRWERMLGKSIPDDFREQCERDMVQAGDDEGYLEDLNGSLEDFFNRLKYLETVDYFSNRKKPKVTATKRYPRCFEKELHIVTFVIGKQKPYIFNVKEPFISRQHIDWKQLCDEWNKAHPFDRMSSEVLKVRYYRAIAKEDIQKAYIRSRFTEIPLDRETFIKAIEDSKNKPLYVREHLLQYYSSLGYRNLKILEKEAHHERPHTQQRKP